MEKENLPTWTNTVNVVQFDTSATQEVERKDVPGVPGAFQLLNVLTNDECDQFVSITEKLGFDTDAPPYSFRHMCNVNWVVSQDISRKIWDRVAIRGPELMGDQWNIAGGKALGINARFRCYRYVKGDYFKPHTDGSWPGSEVDQTGCLQWDAYKDRWSQLTFLVLLSEDYQGGRTIFHIEEGGVTKDVAVRTPKGGVLVFPHGGHPLHRMHSGELVESGEKYMIRTEVLFERNPESDKLQRAWFRSGSGQ